MLCNTSSFEDNVKKNFAHLKSAMVHLIDECHNYPDSVGRSQYLRYLKNRALSGKDSFLAKCFHCSNGYADGQRDCGNIACPLYPHMPYRSIGQLFDK
jgi:hypothetical protein